MTTTIKTTKQGELGLPKTNQYKQGRVDGKGTLKETCPKELQEAADYLSGKKVEESRAKDNVKKAGEKLIKQMETAGKTSIVYFDSEKQHKRRVNILQGTERLKFEDIGVND